MRKAIPWTKQLELKIPEIDADHRNLIALFNKLQDHVVQRASNQILNDVFLELFRYAETHFRKEEEFMKIFGYTHLEEHAQKHRAFTKRVLQLADEQKSGQTELGETVLDFLQKWLVDHISLEDRLYLTEFQSRKKSA